MTFCFLKYSLINIYTKTSPPASFHAGCDRNRHGSGASIISCVTSYFLLHASDFGTIMVVIIDTTIPQRHWGMVVVISYNPRMKRLNLVIKVLVPITPNP
jgi:hypothetical protein